MTASSLPLLLDPAGLAERLDDPDIRIVDLSPGEVFAEHHAPGAVHLPYGEITCSRPPVAGLVPSHEALRELFSQLGVGPDTHVAAMDAEGGGAAGRLLWTLERLGHRAVSLVDGGLRAWVEEGHPIERGPGTRPEPRPFTATPDDSREADSTYIRACLNDPSRVIVDARSRDEYTGRVARAARGGHIPGAIHYEWTRGMDRERSLRMHPRDRLSEELEGLGIRPEHEVITYCHTHHRSGFTYAMLRALGYERVRGYPGSWSDWGNREDTPIATG